jgi:hypothetical protein
MELVTVGFSLERGGLVEVEVGVVRVGGRTATGGS